jgi:hypothetical protein
MFIETVEGTLIPISQIRRIGEARKGPYERLVRPVTTVDGDSFTIGEIDTDKLTATIVQANPGYELLTASHAINPDFLIWREPIIAWRIGIDGNPAPVTAGDSESANQPQAILMPDGQVQIQCDRTFASIEEWEKYARDNHSHARDTAKAKQERNLCG